MSARAFWWTSLRAIAVWVALVFLWLPVTSSWAAESQALDPNQAYAKQATWAETMIATRNNCAAWAQGAKEGQVASTPLAAVWAKIQADWPTHAAWFHQDLPGDRYLDWFLQSNENPHFERWIMSRALPRVAGAGAVLNRELDELVLGNVPTNDMRWLELYARTCRLEDLLAATRPLWLGELRCEFERQAAVLVSTQVPSSDPRWMALRDWAAKCRIPGEAEHFGRIGDLPSAVVLLSEALPGRFSVPSAWSRELAESASRWSGLVIAIVKQDASSLAGVPALADDVRRARQTLLRSLTGMADFLDQRSGVALESEWEQQFAALSDGLANRDWFDQVAPQTLRPEALILPSDRDPADVVIRRTAALLADVKASGAGGLDDAERHLAALFIASATIDPAQTEARYVLYADACRLRRQIAFRNPVLDFNELLFAKHHRAIYPHMCDQYYGIAAMPGGGLYVLSDAFGCNPRPRDVSSIAIRTFPAINPFRFGRGQHRLWRRRLHNA